jgi:ribonuclease D
LITDSAGLERFLVASKEAERIALDTEADSLHCYFEKLCLVQIALPGYSELLDPLCGVDLPRFFEALRDKEVVFHGADYDLRLLQRHGDFNPASIFDTMLAARLCGETHVGLAALVKKYFGVELSKASQKANWAQRPLSQDMIHYALSDVHYLLDLADILRNRLAELGRTDWLAEWVERTIYAVRNPKEKDPDSRWRIAGAYRLPAREQAVLRSLWHWRDAEARMWNRPPFYVMANSDLLRIAELAVAGRPFSTPHFSKARRKRFEQALNQALALPEEQWPVVERSERPRPNPDFSRRFDEFKQRRDRAARMHSLEPSLIASKAALELLAGYGDDSALMQWQKRLLELTPEDLVTNGGKSA